MGGDVGALAARGEVCCNKAEFALPLLLLLLLACVVAVLLLFVRLLALPFAPLVAELAKFDFAFVEPVAFDCVVLVAVAALLVDAPPPPVACCCCCSSGVAPTLVWVPVVGDGCDGPAVVGALAFVAACCVAGFVAASCCCGCV